MQNGLKKELYQINATQTITQDIVNRLIKRLERDMLKLFDRTTLDREQCLKLVEESCKYALEQLRKGLPQTGRPDIVVTIHAVLPPGEQ